MGMYTTILDPVKGLSVQIKCGDDYGDYFSVGERVGDYLPDGEYLGVGGPTGVHFDKYWVTVEGRLVQSAYRAALRAHIQSSVFAEVGGAEQAYEPVHRRVLGHPSYGRVWVIWGRIRGPCLGHTLDQIWELLDVPAGTSSDILVRS